jgi:hypothetical protein
MRPVANFSGLVQAFFTDRLLRQRRASPNPVAGYRDTFRLLLRFAKERLRKPPAKLSLEDLDVAVIGDFLDHLEKGRGNGARSRNTRLAAIHSFFQYVSFQEPAHAEQCRRVLAIPSKRYQRRQIEYLKPQEIDALLATPDRTTWIGRRGAELQRQETLLVQQQDLLLNMRLSEDIDQETFARKHTELRDRLAAIKLQLDAVDRSHDETAELAAKVLELSQTLRQQWFTDDYASKRRILEIVCLNCRLDDATLVPTMRKPFDVLAEGLFSEKSGEGGIRTLGDVAATPVFETGPIGRSGTSPNALLFRAYVNSTAHLSFRFTTAYTTDREKMPPADNGCRRRRHLIPLQRRQRHIL